MMQRLFYFYIDGNDVFDSDSDKDQAIEKSVQFMIDCLKLDPVQINISFNEFFTAAQINDIFEYFVSRHESCTVNFPPARLIASFIQRACKEIEVDFEGSTIERIIETCDYSAIESTSVCHEFTAGIYIIP